MAAHLGVSISSSLLHQSSGLATTAVGVRHRYLTRRRGFATAAIKMATSTGDGGGGESGAGGRRSRGSRSSSSSSSSSSTTSDGGSDSGGGSGGEEGRASTATASGSSDTQLPRPTDEVGMQVDSATSTATGDGDAGDSPAAFRRTRVLSCPTTVVRGAPSPSRGGRGRGSSTGRAGGGRGPTSLNGAFVVAGSADNVSSARGITMGDVRGSVRSKTAPLEEEPVAVMAANQYADTAVAEIISLKLTGGDPAEEGTEMGAGPGIGGYSSFEEERMFRATSSAAAVLCAPAAPEASNKRAKSGATVLNVSHGAGDTGAWTGDKPAPAAAAAAAPLRPPTPAESMSAMSNDKVGAGEAASTAAAASGEGSDPAAVGDGAAAPAAAAAPALSNDEWLARLSPLVQSIPAGTHPEDFLHSILKQRGYSTEMAAMKETVFHRAPEPDQVAAYDKAILRAVLDEDEAALERMRVSGRRMDACNRFGDSVLHMACRRGRAVALRFLLRATGPAGVVLSDDFGRTVLHDACWTASPRFDVASAVLDVDTRLLRTLDSRGSSPLQYVPEDQWPLWCAFFESRKEMYWPQLAPGAEDVAGIIPLTVV
eukprot:g15701.t1